MTHLSAVIIPVMYYLMPWPLALTLMAISTGIFLLVDFLRLRLNPVKSIFIILFGSELRRKEYTGLTGASYLTLATLICMAIFGTSQFGRGVFIAAISFLILGDTAAAIVGLSIGRIRIFQKTLEGTVAGLITCLGVAYVVSILPGLDLPFGIGILGAVAASVAEVLPLEVNDNVVMPLLSGGVMMVALLVAR
jgi:acyl phosphate:glycerol-3-phosphate acyltransferase